MPYVQGFPPKTPRPQIDIVGIIHKFLVHPTAENFDLLLASLREITPLGVTHIKNYLALHCKKNTLILLINLLLELRGKDLNAIKKCGFEASSILQKQPENGFFWILLGICCNKYPHVEHFNPEFKKKFHTFLYNKTKTQLEAFCFSKALQYQLKSAVAWHNLGCTFRGRIIAKLDKNEILENGILLSELPKETLFLFKGKENLKQHNLAAFCFGNALQYRNHNAATWKELRHMFFKGATLNDLPDNIKNQVQSNADCVKYCEKRIKEEIKITPVNQYNFTLDEVLTLKEKLCEPKLNPR